jgi:hypothetical protein
MPAGAIHPIGLGPATSPGHQEARRIEHVRLDPASGQEAGEPEAVVARLVADLDRHGSAGLAAGPCGEAVEHVQQGVRGAAWNQRGAHLGAPPRQQGADEPLGAAQFEGDVAAVLGGRVDHRGPPQLSRRGVGSPPRIGTHIGSTTPCARTPPLATALRHPVFRPDTLIALSAHERWRASASSACRHPAGQLPGRLPQARARRQARALLGGSVIGLLSLP